ADKLSRWLRGDQRMADEDVVRLLGLCGVTADHDVAAVVVLKGQVEQYQWIAGSLFGYGRLPVDRVAWQVLEAEAHEVVTFSPMDLPPELRTRASRRHEFRYSRRRKTTPTYTHLIGEVAFIRSARDLQTTIGQFRSLLRAADKDNVTIRMVPDVLTDNAASYRIVTLADKTAAVCVDLDGAILYRDHPDAVAEHRHKLTAIEETALTMEQTFQFIKELTADLEQRLRLAKKNGRDNESLIAWWTDHPRAFRY
ncbi:Scr1 family TA system antitoxin-like transcriptional regulator, partial [Actinokineospora inagensis]